MKACIAYSILIFLFFFQSFFSNASETKDMDAYVTNTAAVVRNRIEENDKLAEIGSGAIGTYFIDQRLALDGITTVDTATAGLYRRNLYQKYQGDVIILLHIIYPEGEGGKKDVIDSTLLFSQRISEQSDPQHNKTIVHVWSVINRIADKWYTFVHVVSGTNANSQFKNQVAASALQTRLCGSAICCMNGIAGMDDLVAVNNPFKFNFLDPAGRVFTTNNGDVEVLCAIEKGPILAFKFFGGSTIYEAKFSGEQFTGYASKNGSIKYIQSFIDNGANYSIQVPVIGTDNLNGVIVKWYSLSVTKGTDVLSDFAILRCNSCSINTDNDSPIIGAEILSLASSAQVFISEDLLNGNIALGQFTYFRDVAFTDRNVFNSATGTFAGKTVSFIKSATSVYDFSKYLYPATSAFGTKVVDATVKQQVSILNGKTDKLINAVIVTKEKNIIEYNTLKNSYEIRTLTPFDKEPSTIVLPANSIKALCIQATDNTYDIQLGIARENALATKLFNNQSASSLTKIRDFVSSYGQGLKFFGNEYNKAWNEIASLVNQVTETHFQISLTNYKCANVEIYYKDNYTKSQYLIFLTETVYHANYSIFEAQSQPAVGANIVASNGPAPLNQLISIKLAYGMGLWNGVTAVPGDLVSGCAGLSTVFSSESWTRGITSISTYWNTPAKKDLFVAWSTAVGSKIYDKAANADVCEGAYFSGNIGAIIATIVVVPETIVDKIVGLGFKAALKLTGTTMRFAGKVLSYYTSSNIKILELGENYLKVKWKGKDVEIRNADDIDLVSNSLNDNPIDFDDNGILTSDPVLSSRLDALASIFFKVGDNIAGKIVVQVKLGTNGKIAVIGRQMDKHVNNVADYLTNNYCHPSKLEINKIVA